jgi:ubiquinone/menaquinone biosynthesis C-methylase UbiE
MSTRESKDGGGEPMIEGDRYEEIRRFWSEASGQEKDADGLRPTARDPYLQEAVETIMERRLWPGARVLDVGCGDGLSSLRFAAVTGNVLGVDYIQGFVDKARRIAEERGASHATFERADVLDLEPVRRLHDGFDVVTTIRCLINLDSWEKQQAALSELAGCIRPGGLYMASEGWIDGLDGLNLERSRVGLTPIEAARYNLLMKRSDFERAAMEHFDIVGYHGLGTYLYLSRVFQPLHVRPDPPRHNHAVNRTAAALAAGTLADRYPDCDYAGVYVLRRKD